MSDFSPETRNSAIWSGDSRKVAQGKANEVILTKLGMMEIPDLSDVEAVQMGHVMEPVIGRLAQAKLGVELTKIEEALTHPKEAWLRSHHLPPKPRRWQLCQWSPAPVLFSLPHLWLQPISQVLRRKGK